MNSPMVTVKGNNVELKMFPDLLDADDWAVVLKEEDGTSVYLAHLTNYEACLDTMDSFMVSFASLGYELNSEF